MEKDMALAKLTQLRKVFAIYKSNNKNNYYYYDYT